MPIQVAEQVPLPYNPNCITFRADARLVLGEGLEGWLALQKAVAYAVRRFSKRSSFDNAAWLHLPEAAGDDQALTLMFVVDAPATRHQIAAFEEAVAMSELPFRHRGVQNLPEGAFPTLAFHTGRLYQVWLRTEAGPVAVRLLGGGGAIHAEQIGEAQAAPDDFLRGTRHAIGTHRPADPEALALKQRLVVAFSQRVSESIVVADGDLHEAEMELLAKVFPLELTERLGMADQATFDTFARRAETELRDILGYHEKLAILGLLLSICDADGRFGVGELKVLKRAAEAMGLSGDEVVAYWQKLR